MTANAKNTRRLAIPALPIQSLTPCYCIDASPLYQNLGFDFNSPGRLVIAVENE